MYEPIRMSTYLFPRQNAGSRRSELSPLKCTRLHLLSGIGRGMSQPAVAGGESHRVGGTRRDATSSWGRDWTGEARDSTLVEACSGPCIAHTRRIVHVTCGVQLGIRDRRVSRLLLLKCAYLGQRLRPGVERTGREQCGNQRVVSNATT